jgi:hypothetical protein
MSTIIVWIKDNVNKTTVPHHKREYQKISLPNGSNSAYLKQYIMRELNYIKINIDNLELSKESRIQGMPTSMIYGRSILDDEVLTNDSSIGLFKIDKKVPLTCDPLPDHLWPGG